MTAEVESVLGPAPASYSQPEVVVLRFRRHGRRLVWPVLALLAIAGAAGFWVGALPAAWMNLAAAAGGILLALLLGVLPVFSWLAHRTTVTTRRVIRRQGLFSRQRSEVSLGRVREVRSRRGLGQRVWGAGDIELLHGADALQELMERNYEHSARVEQRLANLPGAAAAPAAAIPQDQAGPVSFW
jgi:membrane protein YdbS with pleckstrin-like domain